jgi:hypothetical protein
MPPVRSSATRESLGPAALFGGPTLQVSPPPKTFDGSSYLESETKYSDWQNYGRYFSAIAVRYPTVEG